MCSSGSPPKPPKPQSTEAPVLEVDSKKRRKKLQTGEAGRSSLRIDLNVGASPTTGLRIPSQ